MIGAFALAEVVVRADRARFKQAALKALPVLIVPALILFRILVVGRRTSAGLGWLAVPAMVLLIGLPALLFLAYVWLFVSSTLTVANGTFRLRDWRRRVTVVEHPRTLVLTHIHSSGTSARWYIVGDDRSQVMLNEKQWPPDGLARAWSALGLSAGSLTTKSGMPPDRTQLRQLYPVLRMPVAIAWPFFVMLFWMVVSIGYMFVVVNASFLLMPGE